MAALYIIVHANSADDNIEIRKSLISMHLSTVPYYIIVHAKVVKVIEIFCGCAASLIRTPSAAVARARPYRTSLRRGWISDRS